MEPRTKIGEAQVQEAFVEHLRFKIGEKYGPNFPYAFGAFNGSQDRKYADYFAGVNARNILIEFKEFKSEISSETRKPLRKKLCNSISDENLENSLNAHFISWRVDDPNGNRLRLRIDTYLPTVCPLFDRHFDGGKEKWIQHFLDGFLDLEVGVSNEEFEVYINELSRIAGDAGEGNASFYGVHLTFDPEVGLDLEIFSKVSDLIEFSNGMSANRPTVSMNEESSPDDEGPKPYRGLSM